MVERKKGHILSMSETDEMELSVKTPLSVIEENLVKETEMKDTAAAAVEYSHT